MKKLVFIFPVLLLIFSFCTTSNSKKGAEESQVSVNIPVVKKSIQWYDFTTGFEKAKKEKKIALIDCYTDWCYWCKRLDKDTYTDSSIIELINKKFVAIKFNPEKTDVKHQLDGKTYNSMELLSILSNGKQSGYPTTYFVNAKQNKVLEPFEGYAGPVDFLKVLQEKTIN